MKLSHSLFLAATSLMTACSVNIDAPETKSKQEPVLPAVVQAQKLEYPKMVKAPVAIVFEGGLGNPNFFDETAKVTPIWRAYLCLPASAEIQKNTVKLELEKWGTPADQLVKYKDESVLLDRRLTEVEVTYEHKTSLIKYGGTIESPDMAYGETEMTSSTNANYVYKVKPENELLIDAPSEIFQVELGKGLLASHRVTSILSNGKPMYYSTTVRRFGYDGESARLIEECEKAEGQIVIETDLDKK